jgi:hypothetical protein
MNIDDSGEIGRKLNTSKVFGIWNSMYVVTFLYKGKS